MKSISIPPLPIVICAASVTVFLLLFYTRTFYRTSVIQRPKSQPSISQQQTASKPSYGLPVRITIPAIHVDAGILALGVTSNGEMDVPKTATDTGWFKPGPRPGEKGSAVIAGHFNGGNGEPGVFTDLNKLKEGDSIYVTDANGTNIPFTVRGTRVYNPGYAEEVFSSNDGTHLNLITCDGIWDGNKKSYSKRLVVFADILQ